MAPAEDVLAGNLARAPSRAGVFAVLVALGQHAWLAMVEERDTRSAFGPAWDDYAARTHAVQPVARLRARARS